MIAHTLRGEGFDAGEDGTGRGTPIVPVAFGGNNTSGPIDVAAGLNAKGGSGRMDFETETLITASVIGHGEYASTLPALRARSGDAGGGSEALGASSPQAQAVLHQGVRRLTPAECEALVETFEAPIVGSEAPEIAQARKAIAKAEGES